jgi:hypothetical protein
MKRRIRAMKVRLQPFCNLVVAMRTTLHTARGGFIRACVHAIELKR